jgi:hypothetical protein
MLITDFHHLSEAHLQITFKLLNVRKANLEMQIDLQCKGTQVRQMMLEISRIIDNNRYCLSHGEDCAECDWQQLLALVKRCREESRKFDNQAVIMVKIREGAPCPNDLGFSPPPSVGKEIYNLFDDNVFTTLRSIYLPQESYTGQLTAPAVKPT